MLPIRQRITVCHYRPVATVHSQCLRAVRRACNEWFVKILTIIQNSKKIKPTAYYNIDGPGGPIGLVTIAHNNNKNNNNNIFLYAISVCTAVITRCEPNFHENSCSLDQV